MHYLLTIILWFWPQSTKLTAEKAQSKITYFMEHPMHSWQGVSKDVNCAIVYNPSSKKIEQIAASMKVESFDSGNANRDSHAIEVIEGLKFPKVTFSSTKITQEGDNMLVLGNLTFHGVKKSVFIKVFKKETDKKLDITGDFAILLSEYNIERPSLLGVKASDEMKLKLDLSFRK